MWCAASPLIAKQTTIHVRIQPHIGCRLVLLALCVESVIPGPPQRRLGSRIEVRRSIDFGRLRAARGAPSPGFDFSGPSTTPEEFLVASERADQVVVGLGQVDQDVFDGVVQLQRVGDLALGAHHSPLLPAAASSRFTPVPSPAACRFRRRPVQRRRSRPAREGSEAEALHCSCA